MGSHCPGWKSLCPKRRRRISRARVFETAEGIAVRKAGSVRTRTEGSAARFRRVRVSVLLRDLLRRGLHRNLPRLRGRELRHRQEEHAVVELRGNTVAVDELRQTN